MINTCGDVTRIDMDKFDYYLGVLPPVWMGEKIRLPDGRIVTADFGFAEGMERITAFWQDGEKYYSIKTEQINALS